MCYAIARMDIRSRMRVAFVVECYALDEVGEAGRRTRAMVTALAARGHDVTVLTTCARRPDRWENECGEGKSAIDGVSVVRFRLAPDPNAWLRKPAGVLAPYHARAGALWSRTLGPVCTGYRRYLDHLGYLFDAVFFSGSWGYLVTEGVPRVRNAVLCPTAAADPSRRSEHAKTLFRAVRAVAVATEEEEAHLRTDSGRSWPCPTYVIGAGPDPVPNLQLRSKRMRLVDGPFLLHVGHHGPATTDLVQAFQFFREAHADTPLEDDAGQRMSVGDVRLVLAGDLRFPHVPDQGILCFGPVDDAVRSVLVQRSLAVVEHDPDCRVPTGLISAWNQQRTALVRGRRAALASVLDHAGAEYVYDSPPTFAASAASLLSSRGPRRGVGARSNELARRACSASKLADGLERAVRGVLGRSRGQVVPIDVAGL